MYCHIQPKLHQDVWTDVYIQMFDISSVCWGVRQGEGARAAPGPGGDGIHMHDSSVTRPQQWFVNPRSGKHTSSFDLWPQTWHGLMMDKQKGDWLHRRSQIKVYVVFTFKLQMCCVNGWRTGNSWGSTGDVTCYITCYVTYILLNL